MAAVAAEQVATVLWAAWNGIMSLAWRPAVLRQDEASLQQLLAAATDVVTDGLSENGPG